MFFNKQQPILSFTCATWGTEVTTSARWGFERRWLSRTWKTTRNKSFSVLFSMVLCHPCQLPWCLSLNCRVLSCSEPIAFFSWISFRQKVVWYFVAVVKTKDFEEKANLLWVFPFVALDYRQINLDRFRKKRLQQCDTLVPMPINQLTPSDEILKKILFHQWT